MKRLYSFWDIYKFPFAMLCMAFFLMGVGDFFTNQNLSPIFVIENIYVVEIFEALKYIGSFLVQIFPMMFLVRYLSKRFEDAVPIFNGLIAYLLFNAMTMVFSPANLASYAYNPVLGMKMIISTATSIEVTKYPLFTGIISALIVGWITTVTYKRSRKRFAYGFLGFINNDVWSMFGASFWSMIAGVVVAFGWPYVIQVINQLLQYIASDIYNPTNMFFYGFAEQLLSVFNLQRFIHNPFWFETLGGSWVDNFGKSYFGDVNVWTALFQFNTPNIHYGRFITPYYIINWFIVPATMLSIYFITTDKLKRRRYTMLLIFGIIVSLFSGLNFPLSIVLLLTAPALFFMHTVLVSVLYALLPSISVMVGYSYTGIYEEALPGTIVSYLPYFTNPNYADENIKILIVGVVSAVIYFFLIRAYYLVISGDFLDEKKNSLFTDDVIEALGGTANIRLVNSSYENLTVHLYNSSLLNTERLIELGAFRVVNTRAGIEIEFGARSSNLRKGIAKRIDEYLEKQRSMPVAATPNEVEGKN